YHGDSGPLHLVQPSEPHPITAAYINAGTELGFAPTVEHNGERMTGPTLNTLTIKDGRRQTAADAYLTPDAVARPNLSIMTATRARSLILENGRCRGILAARDGRIVRLTAERAVILAAGTIGSPTLLLQSGIGPADELRTTGITVHHDLPGVGANLHDHLLAGGNVYPARRPVQPSKYQHSESLMYIDCPGGAAAPELVLACVIAPVVTEMFAAPAEGSAYTIMFGFTHPQSRGRLCLASADPDAQPLIDPNYLAEPYDREVFLDALATACAVGATAALADWRAEEMLP